MLSWKPARPFLFFAIAVCCFDKQSNAQGVQDVVSSRVNTAPTPSKKKKVDIDKLIALVASQDSKEATAATKALECQPPSKEILDRLMELVANDKKSRYWNRVPTILDKYDSSQAVSWLEPYSDSGRPLVRRVVASTYATLDLKELPSSLESLSIDTDTGVRSEAIEAIAEIAIKSKGKLFDNAVKLLLRRVEDQSIFYSQRSAAFEALKAIGVGHPDVLPTVIHIAESSMDLKVREEMIGALGQIGAGLRIDTQPHSQVVNSLLELLHEEPTGEMKVRVIRALVYTKSRHKQVIIALNAAKNDDRISVSEAAADMLFAIEKERNRKAKIFDPDDPFN